MTTPSKKAICIDEKDEWMLHTKNRAVLDALYRVQKIEGSCAELDASIKRLEDRLNLLMG